MDQDRGLEEAWQFGLEAADGLCRRQGVEDVHRGGEADGVTGQTGSVSPGDGQGGLAQPDEAHGTLLTLDSLIGFIWIRSGSLL